MEQYESTLLSCVALFSQKHLVLGWEGKLLKLKYSHNGLPSPLYKLPSTIPLFILCYDLQTFFSCGVFHFHLVKLMLKSYANLP